MGCLNDENEENSPEVEKGPTPICVDLPALDFQSGPLEFEKVIADLPANTMYTLSNILSEMLRKIYCLHKSENMRLAGPEPIVPVPPTTATPIPKAIRVTRYYIADRKVRGTYAGLMTKTIFDLVSELLIMSIWSNIYIHRRMSLWSSMAMPLCSHW